MSTELGKGRSQESQQCPCSGVPVRDEDLKQRVIGGDGMKRKDGRNTED